MFKQFLKRVFQNHLGRYLFPFLKLLITPSVQLRKSLLFVGKVKVQLSPHQSFMMVNNKFYLETDIFWLGYPNIQWEQTSRKLWIHLCQNARCIIDIGSNTGIYSLIAKTINAEAEVIAIEPQPNIFETLKKNILINSYQIQLLNLAVSNKSGTQKFYNYGDHTFSELNTTAGSLDSSWNKNRDAVQHSIDVKTKTLDAIIPTFESPKVDLIKLDVETHEPQVFEGFTRLSEHRPFIIVEIHNPSLGKQIYDIFKHLNYSFYHIDETKGLITTKNLGASKDHYNYCLCPKEKNNILQGFEK